ncbi:MAG: VOC family protein [Caulobacterales bacterium]|nr:VOC family protein [Caulobacterales bacterium]
MRYLHTMVRVKNLAQSLKFYCDGLGLKEVRRMESEKGRFTLVFLCCDEDWENAQPTNEKRGAPHVELTYNWPDDDGNVEDYKGGRNFGHLAYEVDNIYEYCAHLQSLGIIINRPPRDGMMAFIKSPDNISIEILQKNAALPIQEPWVSMPNIADW